MTEFSIQNKLYDLLLNLAEDSKPKATNIMSAKELRLMMDIVKDQNPLFANADDYTIGTLISEMFDIHPTTTLISRVSHDTIDEEYRIPTQKEIKPGVTFKLEGMSYNSLGKPVPYYYFHTFPTKELSLVQYSNEFFKIWNKIQEGKAWIKNVFLHRIGDKVTHKEDPESIGIIKGRLPANTNYPKTKPYDNFIPKSKKFISC